MNPPLSRRRSSRRPAQAQRGASLLFAMMTVVALSLAAVALIRSVDTGTTILGNVSFKQDTLMATEQGTTRALDWLRNERDRSPDALDLDRLTRNGPGYSARMIDQLDPTSSTTASNRVVIDWNDDSCRTQRGPTPVRCVAPSAPLRLANGNVARYLIVRLCSDQGSSASGTLRCPRPVGMARGQSEERNEINSQNADRIGSETISEYYRIIVRAQGARNAVSTTETLVHF
jgi:Tfp pilus assembly protein PilX